MTLKPTSKILTVLTAFPIACLLFLHAPVVYGQEKEDKQDKQEGDCAAKIQEAQKYYDQGMIEEIPQILAPCMANGFTRVQKIEAYKLIILSYLFDDNQFEAEKTMLEFLKKYPEYEIMPNDPIEFVYLFESYRTTSVFSFGLSVGFNMTDPRIIAPYTMFNMNQATLKNTMKPGFQVGFGVGRYIARRSLLNFEFYFADNQYKFSDESNMSVSDGINAVTYTENLYKFEFPITLIREFNIRKVNYFVRAGISVANINRVKGEPTRMYYNNQRPIPGENQDISEYRTNWLYGGVIGTGIRYKVPRGVLTLDLRATLGLNNIVRSGKRYDNQELSSKYYYLDDDFSLNVFSFSAGYYFSFYKPKKQR
jgi:hypothetical protein